MHGFRMRSLLCDIAFGFLLQLRSTHVNLDDVKTIEGTDFFEALYALSEGS